MKAASNLCQPRFGVNDTAKARLVAAAIAGVTLAAAPMFAGLAVLTLVLNASAPAMVCTAAFAGSAVDGMVVMYALMSVCHATPWLRRLL